MWTTVGVGVVSDWCLCKVCNFGGLVDFFLEYQLFDHKMCSNAFLELSNRFRVKFYVFQCRGSTLNSFWASREIKILQNPPLRPGSEVSLLKEILKELHREIREKSRYPVPNSEVVKNFEQNRLGTFCYPPWVVLCAKYELLTPSGVRE